MNKIDVLLYQYNKFSHELMTQHRITVDVEDLEEESVFIFLRENLASIHNQAAKSVAEKMVDKKLFNSDAAYSRTVEQLTEDLYLHSLSLHGVEYRPYEVVFRDKKYLESYGVKVWASCAREAEFQAALGEAYADGYSLDGFVVEGKTSRDAVEYLICDIKDRWIDSSRIARTDISDALEVVEKLVNAAKAGNPDLHEFVIKEGSELLQNVPSPKDPGMVSLNEGDTHEYSIPKI